MLHLSLLHGFQSGKRPRDVHTVAEQVVSATLRGVAIRLLILINYFLRYLLVNCAFPRFWDLCTSQLVDNFFDLEHGCLFATLLFQLDLHLDALQIVITAPGS